jgi:ABC-2 type transport system permease protein
MLNSIIKDLKVNILDGKQMLIIIAMPVILTVILSFALGGTFASGGLSEPVNVAIVKQYDENISSGDILESLDGADELPEQAKAAYLMQIESFDPEEILFDGFLDSEDMQGIINYTVMDAASAESALDDYEVSAVVYIPEGFITDTYANMFGDKKQIEFDILADAASAYSADIARQVMNGFADTMSVSFANNEVFEEIGAKYLSEPELMQKMGEFNMRLDELASDAAASIKTENIDQYALIDSFTYYTAAMLCMFMLFSAGIGGRSMLEEKENITYYRMKVLGVTYFQMMVSKLVVVFIICLIQSVVMIGMSSIFFGVQWGNYLTVALVAICGSLAIGGMGSFIGAISLRSGNYKVANAFEGAIVQVLALLGGSYMPLTVLPNFFTTLSKFTVNGQALSAFIKVAQGRAASSVVSEILIILLFGAVFFGAAWIMVSMEGRKENA